MADMNARLLKVGAPVYARVTVDWTGTDCVLRSGAVLEAHVLSVSPYRENGKISEVNLAFTRAQCGDVKMGAFELLLAALAAPPQNSDLGILTAAMPLSTGNGGNTSVKASGIGALKAMQLSSSFNLRLDSPVYTFPVIPHMHMGDVSGIKGLKLTFGAATDNSAFLTVRGHDVSLEKHTLMLLVPAQGTFPRPPANPASAGASGVTTSATEGAPAAPPVDDIDVCVPPQCNVALPSGDSSQLGKAAASISIRDLGYSPRPQREVENFDHDEALAYLGPRELLVAFNPHILASRRSLGRAGWTVRVIRAALVDTETRRVTHTVDWELPDNREYMWPLGDGRVLVHVASELRVYGAGLKILNRVPLDGPLAFVRVTPDAGFVAVGVIRERHTTELHAELKKNLNRDPEEDVDVLVLNRNFEPIAKSNATSGVMPPTLLNEGQARLLALPNGRYRVSMLTWDNHLSTLARFNSTCTPELTSIAPDLIFLVSCNKQSGALEYRIMNSSGKLSLKGGASPNDFGHAAKASANQQAFVVKSVQSSLPKPPGEQFKQEDLSSEEFGVYRAADGKRLLEVRIGTPSSSRDGYALAPDNSQLAVLSRDQVAIYFVGGK